MSATIPESHVGLLEGPIYAILTTLSPSGKPENTVVWCDWDGTHVLVNTAAGRRKPNNVAKNPAVALTAIDTNEPFKWIDVRGTVVEVVDDPDYSHINSLSKLYTGHEEYYGGVTPIEMKGTEQRIIFKIRPDRVLAFPPEG
jgi:PPOX class probable F420-dependent enzyme